MYLIEEKNSDYGTFYEKSFISDDGEMLSKEIIHFKIAKVNYEGGKYLFLYDSDMNPLSEVFDFINFKLQDASSNHRSTALNALKFLYSFLKIYNLKLEKISKNDFENLIAFLGGIPREGTLYNLNLTTLRSDSTLETYLSIYRSYVSFLNYEDSALIKKSNKYKLIFNSESDTQIKIPQYEVSVKNYDPELSTPRYISIDDFKKILTVIRKEYTVREECIVRLMYESGLRIGEVLGSTNEDIVEKESSTYLYLRNRCSDSFDQLAKGCMTVSNKRQYKTSKYKTQNVGYQVVYLSDNLLEKINEYVNEFHQNERIKFQNNYEKYVIADSVEENGTNFYLFINSVGRPLSANLWGKTLREIFRKAGLEVDKEHRETNLSHRFRHGYAMFMVKYKKVDSLKLMRLLRHNNINSVKHYYRPTDEEIIEMRTDFVSSIYDIIPELTI